MNLSLVSHIDGSVLTIQLHYIEDRYNIELSQGINIITQLLVLKVQQES